MKSSKLFRGLSAVSIFLFFTINGLTVGMFNSAGFINKALNTPTSIYVKKANGTQEIPTYFKSEFSKDINNFTQDELKAKNEAAEKFIESEEEESAVLLKNDNNALPLTAEEQKKVSLFGYTTVSPYYRSHSGGGGSQRTVSFLEALESRNIKYNTTLTDLYSGLSYERNYKSVAEAPLSVYSESVKSSFASYNGAAIVTLSREAGENDDLITNYQDSDGTVHSILALNKNEKDMLNLVKEYKENGTFKKIIVLLNTCNTMEVGWLDEYKVDACLWIGGPGMSTGFYGVADLLTGEVNPSGKLVDTYSKSSLSAPAMQNFGAMSTNNLVYAENIYVGYKYYETRYEDVILNRYGANSTVGVYASEGAWDYAKEVTYPFGYGLSYTTFTQTLKGVKDNGDGTLTVTVNVKNTGEVAGKSVVEIYSQTPYGDYEKENFVEKSAIQLAGFEKTDKLNAGDDVDVKVAVDKYS